MITNKIKKRKRNVRKLLGLTILGGIILVLIFSLSLINWKLYKKRVQLKNQVHSVTNKIENVKTNIQALESNIAKTQTQEYLERMLRERLNLKKSGEKVVAVIVSEATEEEDKSSTEEKPWWKVLLERFFKIDIQN